MPPPKAVNGAHNLTKNAAARPVDREQVYTCIYIHYLRIYIQNLRTCVELKILFAFSGSTTFTVVGGAEDELDFPDGESLVKGMDTIMPGRYM